MRLSARAVVLATTVWGAWLTASPSGQPAASAPRGSQNEMRATLAEFEKWMTTLTNWGRWGANDELGAVNLITPAKRTQAAALVKTGETVSLAHALLTEKAADAPTPFVLMPRVQTYAFDRQEIDFHGYAFSHLDALCHVSWRNKLYNGLDFARTVTSTGGCSRLAITAVHDRLVTRAVLIDIPRLKGVSYLELGTHVYREDIEAWEKKAGVKAGPGDVILLRTGRWAMRERTGGTRDLAGYDPSVIPFFKERDVALIGSDAVQDVGNFEGDPLPVHKFAIVAMGANLFDNLDLEALSRTAARLNRYEFMFVAGPTVVQRGTGSPINPIAVF